MKVNYKANQYDRRCQESSSYGQWFEPTLSLTFS